MTTPVDIKALIRRGRGTRTEWLAEDAPLEEIAETMVAIANSTGGTVLIGVKDGKVIGVDDRIGASDRLLEAALSTQPPLIIPLPQIFKVKDASVVFAQIPSGMPHVYAYTGRYLQRDGTKNSPMDPQSLRRLMIERGEMNFEANITIGAMLDDIDWDKAREYARSLSGFSEDDAQQVLLKRGCLVRRRDEIRPSNAGILLFGKDPQRYIINSEINAVRFPSDAMSDSFSRQDIGGTLPDQIRRAETFLLDHMRKDVTIRDRMARVETYEYPMEAARELVVNAVAHRDYSIRGDNIRIFLFSNRMEVHSPGGLPGPMTLQNLRDERFSRNPIIVQVLSDMHFIEKLGYGVDRVMELMQAQNLREPEFEERSGGFRVILHSTIGKQKPVIGGFRHRFGAQEIISFQGRYKGIAINGRQEAALIYLHQDENTRITNSNIKEMFPGIHPETIRRDLADLVSKDILIKMGQKRGSYYVLKSPPATDDDEIPS